MSKVAPKPKIHLDLDPGLGDRNLVVGLQVFERVERLLAVVLVLPELGVVVLDLLPGLEVRLAAVHDLLVPDLVLIVNLLERQLKDLLVDLHSAHKVTASTCRDGRVHA